MAPTPRPVHHACQQGGEEEERGGDAGSGELDPRAGDDAARQANPPGAARPVLFPPSLITRSLAYLAASSRFVPFVLLWAPFADTAQEHLWNTIPFTITHISLQQKQTLLHRILRITRFGGDWGERFISFENTVVRDIGFPEREVFLFLSLLPEECIQDRVLQVKMEFRKSPLSRQLLILEGIANTCLSLRPLLSSLDHELIESKLHLFESLLESCFLIAYVDGFSAGIGVLFAEYLGLQLRVATNNRHFYIPEDPVFSLLLQTENAIVLNTCAWFVKELLSWVLVMV